MTPELASAIDALPSRYGIQYALGNLARARSSGSDVGVDGAKRLLNAEIDSSKLSVQHKAALRVDQGLEMPPVAVIVTKPVSAPPVAAVAPRRAALPIPKPDDGSDVLALVRAAGIGGFRTTQGLAQ